MPVLDEMIENIYHERENYKVVYTNAKTNNAIVFFTSHGLYEDAQTFEENVVKNDRFEWANISKSPLIANMYKLIVFVRDVRRSEYRFGVNSEINTNDKLIEKIEELTKGYNLTTCGSSAGAYIAELVGMKLNAERVFSISGYYKIVADDKYSDLTKFKNSVPIFYFVPYLCQGDKTQYEYSKSLDNVYSFLIDSDVHGVPLQGTCYPYLLSAHNNELISLFNKYKNKITDKELFYHSIIPVRLKFTNFLKFIFSVGNEYNKSRKRKVVTLLGFKMKFKVKQ